MCVHVCMYIHTVHTHVLYNLNKQRRKKRDKKLRKGDERSEQYRRKEKWREGKRKNRMKT